MLFAHSQPLECEGVLGHAFRTGRGGETGSTRWGPSAFAPLPPSGATVLSVYLLGTAAKSNTWRGPGLALFVCSLRYPCSRAARRAIDGQTGRTGRSHLPRVANCGVHGAAQEKSGRHSILGMLQHGTGGRKRNPQHERGLALAAKRGRTWMMQTGWAGCLSCITTTTHPPRPPLPPKNHPGSTFWS
jgi:hypothetical protein